MPLDLAAAAFVRPLGHEVVRLVGPDTRRFCNGMFTNNARDLAVGAGQRSAMLDDRGRLQGVMDLYCVADDDFIAVLEGVTAVAFSERYKMYIVFDDVEIIDPQWFVLTVQGAHAAAHLRAAGVDFDPQGAVIGPESIVAARDRCGAGGFDLIGSSEFLAEVDLGLPEISHEELEMLRVRAGIPRWPVDMSDKQLPHEMGMRDAFLHFEKGCYVGQETVNRVDVMGQVRRELAGLRVAGERLPPHGAEVRVDGKKLGTLTSPVVSPDQGVLALAVLKKPFNTPGTWVQVVAADRVWDAVVSELPFVPALTEA